MPEDEKNPTWTRMILLTVALWSLMGLDVVTTEFAITKGLSEGNPLMQTVVVNPGLHLLIKAVALMIIVLFALRCERDAPSCGTHMMTAVTGFYLAVLTNNIMMLVAGM
ncbi:MAG: DUF5658 family protein [Methanomicrobiales archaeon]|nr:DUF5658 family protein [Methanomicrobiales archaeon]